MTESAATRNPAEMTALPRPAASFEALYEAHVDDVWRAVRRLGVDGATVDDVVQETFVTAWKTLGRFEGRSQVKTWLIGIAFNHARHALRARGQREFGPLEDTLPSQRQGPEEDAARTQQKEQLLVMLRALPADQREVLVLMDLEGFSAPEVAELSGASVNTVYSRLRLARAAIDAAVARLEGQ